MMETIKEYIISKQENPFYDTTTPYNTPMFLREESFQEEIRNAMFLLYGDYVLRKTYAENPEQIPLICNYMYSMDNYRYEGLYNSEHFEYNPIENYRMVETSKETNSGRDATNTQKGEQTNNENLGSRSDSVYHGSQITTTEEKVAPYETNSYKSKTMTEEDVKSYSDNITNGAQQNTYTEGSRNDSLSIDYGKVTDGKLERSGNIGVTTSQQMIESERQLRDFSVVKVICADLAKYLCDRVSYGEFDS